MIEFESHQVVHEVLASLPFTFGFAPRESVVFTTVALEPGCLTIGASARLDLPDLEHPAAVNAVDHVCSALLRTGADSALVTVHTEREIGPWVFELADLVTARWPFLEHGGYHVLSAGTIHGFAPDGEPRGTHDALELLTTRVAMSQPAQAFVRGPEDFRVERVTAGEMAERVAAELDRLPPACPSHEESTLWWAAVERGSPRGSRMRARLLRALDHIPFRDGVIAAAVSGNSGGDLTWQNAAFDDPLPPDRDMLERVQGVLEGVARHAPPGRAVSPLAVAAYLAWWSGDGARARVLAEQALEEDPHHSLAGLVRDALARACPPPWFPLAGPALHEPRSSARNGW